MSPTRLALGTLLLVAVVTAGLLVTLRPGSQPVLPDDGDGGDPSADVAVIDSAAATEADRAIAVDAGADTGEPERTAVDEVGDADDDGGGDDRDDDDSGPTVVVLRGHPPEPAPFAEVAWVDRDTGQARFEALPAAARRGQIWADLPRLLGQHARAGEDGHLRLPPTTGRWIVSATADDGAAFAAGTARPGRVLKLLLLADETLRVAVVDAHGRPEGEVPIGVGYASPKADPKRIATATTDAAGIAVVPHFQLQRPVAAETEHFTAFVAAPLATPSFSEFAGRPAPREPIALALEPTSPLAVSVHHHGGAPILMPLAVTLQPDRDDGGLAQLAGGGADQLHRQKPLGAAPLQFPHLGRGVPLRPLLHIRGERRPRTLPVAVPEGRDGAAELRLVLPTDITVVALQATRADGTAAGGVTLGWSVATAPSSPALASGDDGTLADGRTDLLLSSAVLRQARGDRGTDAPLQLLLRSEVFGEVVGARVELGAPTPGVRLDLGKVTLLPEPCIARGTATDDLGAPLPDTRVTVELLTQTAKGERWLRSPLLEAVTDEDGAFALFGAPPQQPFRLFARHRGGYIDDHTGPLLLGGDVRLRLVRAGVIRGVVSLPDWVTLQAATVAIQRDDPDADGQQGSRQTHLLRNGLFAVARIEPGIYTVAISLRNLPEPIAVVPGVRVAPGGDDRDPRLWPLDLRQALFRYRLRAVGPAGQDLPIDGPIVWHRRQPTGEQTAVAFRWERGRAQFVADEPLIEVTTLAAGYPPTRLSLMAGERDVVLQPVVPFRVELPGVRASAGQERAIRVSAILDGDSGLPQALSGEDQQNGRSYSFPRWELGKSGGGWLDAGDGADLQLALSGTYDIVLRLYEGAARQGRQASVPLGSLEVRVDGSQTRPAVLVVDPQLLQAALAQLAPRPAGGGR